MFKIIVVLWFLRFFVNLFTNNFTLRYLYKGYLESLEKHNIKENDDFDAVSKDVKVDVVLKMIYIVIVGIYGLFMCVVDFIIMLNMIKYDPTLVTKLFLLATFIHTIVSFIKAKFAKKKEENLVDSTRRVVYNLERFSFYKFACRVINFLYWGYAIYLLFF